MENKVPEFNAETVDMEGSAPSEVHDVKRLLDATDNLEGPVVMAGRASADCFRYAGEVGLQAGQPDPAPEPLVILEDGSFKRSPRKLDW